MARIDDGDRRIAERLTRISEAMLLINDDLDLEAVLQRVLDSARALTGARYGVMTTVDEAGRLEDFLASGMTRAQAQTLWDMPGGQEFLEYIDRLPGPLRVSDFAEHTKSKGLPDFLPPAPMGAFLTTPVRHRGDRVGNIHMAKGTSGEEFSREDEETLIMFASQAALAIANARRYRDERSAKTALETLVETSPVGIAVFDARTGAPLSYNREIARIVDGLRDPNQPPEGLLDELVVRRADGQEISLKELPLAEALMSGDAVRAEEIALRAPDGRSVSALLNATPVLSAEGETEVFVVTLQDMTPMEDMERLRAEFLGMVSHELRAPLTSIKGATASLMEMAENLDPAELRQFLRIIMSHADNMRDQIGDLLDVARIASGSLSVSPEPCEAATLIDRARSVFASGGGRDNLDIQIAPDLPLAMADRRRVAQVIVNLLSNAARHSPNSSPIRVSASLEGDGVAFSIADEGRGIPSDQMPRLFRKFAVNPMEAHGDDAGLGLAICKGIVEAHGGRIWAESSGPGLGARFTFTLPAAEAARESRAPARRPQPDSEEDVPILVVDDDPQALWQVRNALSGAGYLPIVTADPDEARRAMEERRPHLVLMDMMLSGSDGIELMGDLASVSGAPVIFISAYGGDQMIARALDAGGEDYIVKPFSSTELVARVRTALRRRDSDYRTGPSEPYALGDLAIDYDERLVTLAGNPIHLTAMEYGLLTALSSGGGRVVTHQRLFRRVWPPGKTGDARALRTLLRRLRLKLGEDGSAPKYIFAVHQVGYRMPRSARADGAASNPALPQA